LHFEFEKEEFPPSSFAQDFKAQPKRPENFARLKSSITKWQQRRQVKNWFEETSRRLHEECWGFRRARIWILEFELTRGEFPPSLFAQNWIWIWIWRRSWKNLPIRSIRQRNSSSAIRKGIILGMGIAAFTNSVGVGISTVGGSRVATPPEVEIACRFEDDMTTTIQKDWMKRKTKLNES
jgi:hypothetical protein